MTPGKTSTQPQLRNEHPAKAEHIVMCVCVACVRVHVCVHVIERMCICTVTCSSVRFQAAFVFVVCALKRLLLFIFTVLSCISLLALCPLLSPLPPLSLCSLAPLSPLFPLSTLSSLNTLLSARGLVTHHDLINRWAQWTHAARTTTHNFAWH